MKQEIYDDDDDDDEDSDNHSNNIEQPRRHLTG
jgi:hypothetical protein